MCYKRVAAATISWRKMCFSDALKYEQLGFHVIKVHHPICNSCAGKIYYFHYDFYLVFFFFFRESNFVLLLFFHFHSWVGCTNIREMKLWNCASVIHQSCIHIYIAWSQCVTCTCFHWNNILLWSWDSDFHCFFSSLWAMSELWLPRGLLNYKFHTPLWVLI